MAFFLLRLSDHLQYLERVRSALGGGADFQGVDHDSCLLGVWLNEVAAESADLETEVGTLLAELRRLHERFHAASSEALQLRDDPARAEPHVTELFRLSAALVDLMFRLDRLDLSVPSP